VAHWLRDRGFGAYAVRGGIAALTGEGLEAEPVLGEEATRAPPARVLAALRAPLFRRYSTGVLLSLIGNWVEAAAYGYVVLLLGGSAATLGLIGFLNTIPNLVFALPAGALADRYDRRKLLLIFQSLNMALAAALAVTWATGTLTVRLIGVLAVLGGIFGTLSFAPFQAMLAATVPRRDLGSAVAINSLSLQVARFVGPAIAGFLLAAAGPTWVFGVNAASFVAVLGTLAILPASRPVRTAAAKGGAISEGFRYVFGQRSLAAMMVLMLVAGRSGRRRSRS
jgi:MFS family permease